MATNRKKRLTTMSTQVPCSSPGKQVIASSRARPWYCRLKTRTALCPTNSASRVRFRSVSENLLSMPPQLCVEAHILKNQRRDTEYAELRRGFPTDFLQEAPKTRSFKRNRGHSNACIFDRCRMGRKRCELLRRRAPFVLVHP